MKKLIVSIILSIFLLSGCSTFNSLKAIKESVVQVSDGNVMYKIKSVELNSSEITILDHSFNNLRQFIDKWTKIDKIENLEEFLSEYAEAKISYLAVHRVIENNFSRYATEIQVELKKYKQDAVNIDNIVYKMILAKDMYKTGKEAVKLAKVVIGMLK